MRTVAAGGDHRQGTFDVARDAVVKHGGEIAIALRTVFVVVTMIVAIGFDLVHYRFGGLGGAGAGTG